VGFTQTAKASDNGFQEQERRIPIRKSKKTNKRELPKACSAIELLTGVA